MPNPAQDTQLPSRRDVRTGAAEPAPPTGMIPVIPLVSKPSGDPYPARRELRTGLIQVVAPAAGQAAGPTKYVRIEKPQSGSSRSTQRSTAPRKTVRTAWVVSTVVVLAAVAAVWFAFLR